MTEPNDAKAQAEQEALESLKRAREERELDFHIPPEHIVNGECSMETLNRYLTIHPMGTYRAVEAFRMLAWMKPVTDQQAQEDPFWGLHDILGDKTPEPEEGTTDGSD